MDHFRLLREIWPLLRERLVEPLELIPYIRGLNDNDIESIRAAHNTNKMTAIDRLYDALRRRDRKCFYSFLVALREHEYKDLANEIIEIGGIQPEWLPRPYINAALTGTRNQSALRVEPPPAPRVVVQEDSYSSVQTRNSEYTAKPTTPEPLTEETELRQVLDSIYDCWASELNRGQLWRKLGQKFRLTRQKIKELQAESNPGEAVLDLIAEINPGFRVRDLMQLLQGERMFSDLLQQIRRDVGDYNNLDNISCQQERGQDNTEYPPRNDSTSNLQNNENTLLYTRSQNNSFSQEFSSDSQSKIASSSKSDKFLGKNIPGESEKSSTAGITLTGDFTSCDQEIPGQKDNQLPPSVTISVQSESSNISPVIKRSQQEIQRENERKGSGIREDESKGKSTESTIRTGPTSCEIEAFHHTSPKSSFLDDNLNHPEDLYKKIQSTKDVTGHRTEMETTRGLDDGAPNLDVGSVLSRPEENAKQTSLAGTFHPSNIQERGPIVHVEQSDSNQEGSSITKAVKDFRKALDNETFESTSDIPRPQEISMNIPVQSSGPIVQNEQSDSYQDGSSKDAKELREKLEEVSQENASNITRPSGNSINIPVLTAGSTEEGNPIAAPDSTVSSGSDLFQSCPVESGSGGQGEEQTGSQIVNSTTVPVQPTDESGAKNLEMEARELQNDMANQPSTQSYRDIQNSMPDQVFGGDQNCVNSLINRLHYDTEETSQSQTHDQSTPRDTQNNISGTLQMSDSMSISGVLSNIAGPNDNLVSTTTDNSNCSLTSTEES
ncbi:uncharacterized protein LOC133194038 [Saccostrea echinata]|uniref:uncharacterized protein LOC133194038 n=1 Tax=Saccostrea echinata TaxID=191078 RepID=UPI002A82E6B5|nr:uncharacterized protein LOC133194038 [Saccostrea echinata]